ncbi:MAG: hypothetical protein E6J14_02415 [Chloroflexi bacterium]|nr:MAG: hypothetical protein E6J14_02415 [Chloroflexota bacterium]
MYIRGAVRNEGAAAGDCKVRSLLTGSGGMVAPRFIGQADTRRLEPGQEAAGVYFGETDMADALIGGAVSVGDTVTFALCASALPQPSQAQARERCRQTGAVLEGAIRTGLLPDVACALDAINLPTIVGSNAHVDLSVNVENRGAISGDCQLRPLLGDRLAPLFARGSSGQPLVVQLGPGQQIDGAYLGGIDIESALASGAVVLGGSITVTACAGQPAGDATRSDDCETRSATVANGELAGRPTTVKQGESIAISGDGWKGGSRVTLVLAAQVLLQGELANPSGRLDTTVHLPLRSPVGALALEASGIGPDGSLRVLALTVDVLARTSSTATDDSTPSLLWALALGAAGLASLVLGERARRRRREREHGSL